MAYSPIFLTRCCTTQSGQLHGILAAALRVGGNTVKLYEGKHPANYMTSIEYLHQHTKQVRQLAMHTMPSALHAACMAICCILAVPEHALQLHLHDIGCNLK